MTHKPYHGGLPTHLPFAWPTTWSPEQALAGVELLDDLREWFGQHYGLALHNLLREQYGQTHPADDHAIPVDDTPY